MQRIDRALSMLRECRVVVYVSSAISDESACDVVRALREGGADVRVAITRAALRTVSRRSLAAASGHQPTTGWAGGDPPGMAHLALAGWADLQVAVGASADLIARLSLGLADDVVTAAALACAAPLLVAVGMDCRTSVNPATRAHIQALRERGATVIEPSMADPRAAAGMAVPPDVGTDDVVTAAEQIAMRRRGTTADPWLTGEHVVVTAGGTREPLDPVRYIGNRSSGKMGTALAFEALRLGAGVTLVTAAPPPPSHHALAVVGVSTAEQMLQAVRAALPRSDILIMAAAVADYRPVAVSSRKLTKSGGGMHLELEPTVDVLGSIRDMPERRRMTVVGFAAETDDLLENARRKLEEKALDLIVANDVSADDAGIEADDNAVTIITRGGRVIEVPRAPKPEIAAAILSAIREVHESVRAAR